MWRRPPSGARPSPSTKPCRRGVLKGAAATKARTAYGQAHQALLAARQAKVAGDVAHALDQASEASRLSGEVARITATRDEFGRGEF